MGGRLATSRQTALFGFLDRRLIVASHFFELGDVYGVSVSPRQELNKYSSCGEDDSTQPIKEKAPVRTPSWAYERECAATA